LEVIVLDVDFSLRGSGLTVIHVVVDYGRRYQSVIRRTGRVGV
jgi:hypothetical protein